MRMRFGKTLFGNATRIALSVVAINLTMSSNAQVPCRYEVTFWPNTDCGFGPYPGDAVALNAHGHLLGSWTSCGEPVAQPFLWTGGPTITLIPIPPGYREMRPEDMNDLGEIVGRLQLPKGTPSPFRAFLRRPDGQVIDLGLPPGAINAQATSINNKSEIVGFYTVPFVGYRPFIWKEGNWTLIDVPSGSEWVALDINDEGQIALWQWGSQGYVWCEGIFEPIGTLSGGSWSEPNSIAANGNVCGRASTSEIDSPVGLDSRAYLFDGKRLLNLGLLPGTFESTAFANSNMVTVGWCSLENNSVAFHFANGALRALHDLQPIPNLWLPSAHVISDSGVIATQGIIADQHYGVIMTPVYAPVSDIDASCTVNVHDLLAVIDAWGACDPEWFCPADLNDDKVVDKSDLLTVIQHWGQQS